MRKIARNSVGIAGEFAVLSQLTLRGYDANMTLGNTKSVDILASDPSSGKMFKIEVKTHCGNNASHSKLFGNTLDWVMSDKHESIIDPNLYYVFVNIGEGELFRFFLVPSNVVAKYVKEQHDFWLSHRISEVSSEIVMRRFRIGLDSEGYSIQTPLAKDYENNWDILQ